MKELKKIPQFKNEDEEREFWSVADSTDYIDWSKAKPVRFPNLKPSSETISLRIPLMLLDEIKIMANKRDIPYQSLMKVILADAVNKEAYLNKILSSGSRSYYTESTGAGLVMDTLPKKKKPKRKTTKAK